MTCRRSTPAAKGDQAFTPHVQPGWNSVMPMIDIDVALELLHAVQRKALHELTQRSEAARVPLPNVLDPAKVGIADTCSNSSSKLSPRSCLT